MNKTRQDTVKSNQDLSVITLAYQVIASRRLGYDTSMWQVPALSFAAQSFLFTIALGSSNPPTNQRIAAILALVMALISLQLMARHRHFEKTDSKSLQKLEEKMGMNEKDSVGFLPHGLPEQREAFADEKPEWYACLSSYKFWMAGLILFAIASFSIVIITFANPALLQPPR